MPGSDSRIQIRRIQGWPRDSQRTARTVRTKEYDIRRSGSSGNRSIRKYSRCRGNLKQYLYGPRKAIANYSSSDVVQGKLSTIVSSQGQAMQCKCPATRNATAISHRPILRHFRKGRCGETPSYVNPYNRATAKEKTHVRCSSNPPNNPGACSHFAFQIPELHCIPHATIQKETEPICFRLPYVLHPETLLRNPRTKRKRRRMRATFSPWSAFAQKHSRGHMELPRPCLTSLSCRRLG